MRGKGDVIAGNGMIGGAAGVAVQHGAKGVRHSSLNTHQSFKYLLNSILTCLEFLRRLNIYYLFQFRWESSGTRASTYVAMCDATAVASCRHVKVLVEACLLRLFSSSSQSRLPLSRSPEAVSLNLEHLQDVRGGCRQLRVSGLYALWF